MPAGGLRTYTPIVLLRSPSTRHFHTLESLWLYIKAFKKPPSFENRGVRGVCLGHDSRIASGVLVVSVVNGDLKEVCSVKVRNLGERAHFLTGRIR